MTCSEGIYQFALKNGIETSPTRVIALIIKISLDSCDATVHHSDDLQPGADLMKLMKRVKFKVNFTSFQKNYPMKCFFVELLVGITLKIQVKCNKKTYS